MSRWTGGHYKGARRDDKAAKRREAVERNTRTLPENRSTKRQWAEAGLYAGGKRVQP